MTSTAKHFLSFSDLGGLVAEKILHGVVTTGGGLGGSDPVPVLRQGQVQIAFMIYHYALLGPGQVPMSPPTKVAWFDPVSGNLTAEASVTPDYFGQKDSPNKSMGSILTTVPSGIYDNYLKRQPVLFDMLFPAWATNFSPSGHRNLQVQASDFLKIFFQISEPPLRPYYEALGRDWFGWLRALAQ